MRRPLVAGNWKMHGTRASVDSLIQGLQQQLSSCAAEIAVFPSSLHLMQVIAQVQSSLISVGAQNCAQIAGFSALTGEVSAEQLVDAGCKWVLVGHSERRTILGESDDLVGQKYQIAQLSGLKPILCVGETQEERQSGKTMEVVSRQLEAVFNASGIEAFREGIIAYEPVWAIGTGLTASPEQAQEVHAAIRAQLARESSSIAQGVRILYGGSVKASNAAELFAMEDIDGGLVGGASLSVDEFGAICRAAGN